MKVLILGIDRQGKVQGQRNYGSWTRLLKHFFPGLAFKLCPVLPQTSRPQLSWDFTYYVWMSFQSDLKDRHCAPSEEQ